MLVSMEAIASSRYEEDLYVLSSRLTIENVLEFLTQRTCTGIGRDDENTRYWNRLEEMFNSCIMQYTNQVNVIMLCKFEGNAVNLLGTSDISNSSD